jgi:hypothetical protein
MPGSPALLLLLCTRAAGRLLSCSLVAAHRRRLPVGRTPAPPEHLALPPPLEHLLPQAGPAPAPYRRRRAVPARLPWPLRGAPMPCASRRRPHRWRPRPRPSPWLWRSAGPGSVRARTLRRGYRCCSTCEWERTERDEKLTGSMLLSSIQ